MATNMTFIDYQTLIPADWLNNVNAFVNSLSQGIPSVNSIAALRLVNKNTTTLINATGYYTTGDGGGGLYYLVGSDISSADNGGTIIVGADGGRWYLAITQPISIKQFGAKGDGTTNDTTSIQNCINWVQSTFFTDFWMTYVKAIRAPAGNYIVSGLTISYPIHFYGDGNEATAFNLASGSNTHVFTITDMSGTLSGSDIGNAIPRLTDFTIGGNSSGQTGTSDGIHLNDASVPIGTAYHGGAEIANVTIRACLTHGLYIGVNRNNGRINNLKILYSGSDNVFSNGYDWRCTEGDFGNSVSGAGWNQFSGGALEMTKTNIFFNQLAGLAVQSGVNASCTFNSSYFDTNGSQGAFLDNSYGDIVAHTITNSVFRDNSRVAGNNAQPHIQLNNQPFTVIANNLFIVNTTATQPNYLVQFTGTTGPCLFSGNAFEVNDALNTPFKTAITNNFSKLYVSGTEKVGLAQLGNSTMGVIGTAPNFDIQDTSSTSTNQRWRHSASGNEYFFSATPDDGSSASTVFQVTRTGTTPNAIQTISVQPYADNNFPLGAASNRWTVVYATTGTINTSDANQKEEIQEIPDVLIDAFATLTPKMFKMQGGKRWHVGYLAQDMQQALLDLGEDPSKYAVWCEDDVDGVKQQGLRYDQIAVLRDALDKRMKQK